MDIKLKERDEVITSEGYLGVITKITDKSIWFGDKCYRLETVLKDIKSVLYNQNPDIKIDWTNKKAVESFYHSFKRWTFYISGGCKYTTELCEVKNGMVCHNGEYYLPAPTVIWEGNNSDWCGKETKEIKDGLYYVSLYKRVSGYYSTMGGEIMNVFYTKEATSVKEQESLKLRKEWNYYTTPVEQSVEHIKALDLGKILSKELDFIKNNMLLFFNEHLPFTASNGVCINRWESFKNPLACSKGLLYINNSYRGNNPSGLDYGLMFNFHPSFSNESRYYASCDVREFSPKALEQIAVKIKQAVESYCKL
jgi:hypothetical protein